ncbi:MAG: hypothetical protein ACYC5G_05895, partial [Candidatus Doudnabacteria bacterium]
QRQTLAEMNKSIFSQQPAKDPQQEIEDMLENDDYYQDQLNKQGKAQTINVDLAREVMAVLSEADGQIYSVNQDNKYIDWEMVDTPYRILRRAGATEAGRLIKNKRRLDLAQYARIPRKDEVQRGVVFEFTNPDYQPSKEERAKLREWERRLVTNFFFAANDTYPNLARFIGNAYEDWFDLDDITFRITRDGLGTPIAIQLEDPMIWKPVIKKRRSPIAFSQNDPLQAWLEDYETMLVGDTKALEIDEPDYLLIHNERRYAAATRETVRKNHFFTRSDFRLAQRGFSIVEQGLNILTYIINALKMNASNFTNNRLPEGFVAFTGGGVGGLQLEKLKKIMYAHMTGAGNTNRFPMISMKGEKGDAKWINIRSTSREMEYHLWMTLLFSIWCQLSGTDPRELSLGAHSDAVKSSSLSSENTDGIIKESKDIGAKTFLTHFEDSLNTPGKSGQNIFYELTGLDIKIRCVGFQILDKKLKYEIRSKSLESDTSLNEILAEEDKEKYSLVVGGIDLFDVPALDNPMIKQGLQAKIQQNIQKEAAEAQAQLQPGLGGGPAPQPGQENQPTDGQQQEPQYTEADRELLKKYGDDKNVDIDEQLRKQILGESK